jgi:hypothetical protein
MACKSIETFAAVYDPRKFFLPVNATKLVDRFVEEAANACLDF